MADQSIHSNAVVNQDHPERSRDNYLNNLVAESIRDLEPEGLNKAS